MRARVSAFMMWLALSGLLGTGATQAAVTADETQQVQQVVRAQLAAFASDDAERAFSFAAPALREMFGNSAVFMQMVRSSYAVVYRPASVAFLQAQSDGDGTVIQPVQMTDGQGASWIAVYRLQRQPDTSWRIAGCVLMASSSRTA